MRVSRLRISSRSQANDGPSCAADVLVLALVSAPDTGGDPSLQARRSRAAGRMWRDAFIEFIPFLDSIIPTGRRGGEGSELRNSREERKNPKRTGCGLSVAEFLGDSSLRPD